MSKTRTIPLIVLVMAACLIFAFPTFAAEKFFVIATGGTGGTYYPLGGALAQALSSKVPNLIVTAQSGNASTANLNLIAKHQIESAFVQNNTAYQAYMGIDQFDGKPVKNVRGIASLYPEVIQILVLRKANIQRVADLKGKRVIPGDRGSGTAVDAENLCKAAGVAFKDFGVLDWLSFSGIAQRLKDGQTDAGFITAGIPTAAVMELFSSTTDIDIVHMDAPLIKKITDTWPFYAKVTIPAGTYRGQPKAVDTVAVMAQWVTDAAVPDDMIYKLTKALWEEGTHVLRGDKAPSAAAIMAEVHAKGKDVQLKTALDGMAIPLHAGAEKYYREKGLLK